MKEYTILEQKYVASDKIIALVHWKENTHTPFSTHCIFPQGSKGLYHGNYYKDIVSAVDNYKERK